MAPFVSLALLAAGVAACTSQRAIVISAPKDAATDAKPPPMTDAAADVAADSALDLPSEPARDLVTDPPTDAARDLATDPPAEPAKDSAADHPSDPGSDGSSDPARDPAADPASESATPRVLFRDDFGGGLERFWQPPVDNDGPARNGFDGSNAVVTLDATDSSYTRLRCNLDGSLFSITDITASMRFRVERATGPGRVRLDVRQASGTENIFYAVGALVDPDGIITKVGIYKKVTTDEPNYTICALAEVKLDPPVSITPWRTLKLTVHGYSPARLVAYFDDAQIAAYVDDCVSTLTATNGNTVANGGCLPGQTGLGIQVEQGVLASVDDVLVTAP